MDIDNVTQEINAPLTAEQTIYQTNLQPVIAAQDIVNADTEVYNNAVTVLAESNAQLASMEEASKIEGFVIDTTYINAVISTNTDAVNAALATLAIDNASLAAATSTLNAYAATQDAPYAATTKADTKAAKAANKASTDANNAQVAANLALVNAQSAVTTEDQIAGADLVNNTNNSTKATVKANTKVDSIAVTDTATLNAATAAATAADSLALSNAALAATANALVTADTEAETNAADSLSNPIPLYTPTEINFLYQQEAIETAYNSVGTISINTNSSTPNNVVNANGAVFTTYEELTEMGLGSLTYQGAGLYAGDAFPPNFYYIDAVNDINYKIPLGAIYIGTETIYNNSSITYQFPQDGVPVQMDANDPLIVPYINFPVNATVGTYSYSLVCNDTALALYSVVMLEDTISIQNNLEMNILVVSEGSTYLIEAKNTKDFNAPVGVILPPNTEQYSENYRQTIDVLGSTDTTGTAQYMSITNMSNYTEGSSNNIQASNNTIRNISMFDISIPMQATSTNVIYNQTNDIVEVTSHGITYQLHINQARQFDFDAFIILKANIQTGFAADGITAILSGTNAASNGTRVTVYTEDMSLRPMHYVTPPKMCYQGKESKSDLPKAAFLLGVNTSCIKPHVNFFVKMFDTIVNTVSFLANGMADGIESAVLTLPTTIKHLPHTVKTLPHFIKELPADSAKAGEDIYKVSKFAGTGLYKEVTKGFNNNPSVDPTVGTNN